MYWLRCLKLTGTGRDYEMRVKTGQTEARKGSDGPIDSRLWALLRVLYSPNEQSLLDHGYTPFTLGNPGSMLDYPTEAAVMKTLVGVLGVLLGGYPTDIESDIALMQSGDEEFLIESTISAATQAVRTHQGGSGPISASAYLSGIGGSNTGSNGKFPHQRYFDDLLVDSTTNDEFSTCAKKLLKVIQIQKQRRSSRGSEGSYETFLDLTAKSIKKMHLKEAKNVVTTLDGVKIGHEPNNMASAATEATVPNDSIRTSSNEDAKGHEGSLEDMIVKKLKNELEQAVEGIHDGDNDKGEGGGEEYMDINFKQSNEMDESSVMENGEEDGLLNKHAAHRMHFTIDISESSYGDIGADGSVSPNIRQAMLYRIRKKKGIRKVIEALGDAYSRLQAASATRNSAIPSLLPSEETLLLITRRRERGKLPIWWLKLSVRRV